MEIVDGEVITRTPIQTEIDRRNMQIASTVTQIATTTTMLANLNTRKAQLEAEIATLEAQL